MEYNRIIWEKKEDFDFIDPGRSLQVTSLAGLLENDKHREFAGKAFYLNNDYDWKLGKDKNGWLVLIPLKKLYRGES